MLAFPLPSLSQGHCPASKSAALSVRSRPGLVFLPHLLPDSPRDVSLESQFLGPLEVALQAQKTSLRFSGGEPGVIPKPEKARQTEPGLDSGPGTSPAAPANQAATLSYSFLFDNIGRPVPTFLTADW